MNTKEKSMNELNLIGFQFEYIHFFPAVSLTMKLVRFLAKSSE